jgi:uncharacterized protein YraI
MRLRIVGFLIAFATFGSAAAQAERAFTMADVNLRTGPDVEFPSVDVILEGEPVDIQGCLRDESWCDVSWYGGRGWVFSEYLAVEDDGQIVPLLDVGLVEFSIPYVSFAVADYWGRYYVGRPWYRDRDRWFSYRVRSRSGWYGPPNGPRRPGWWRSGYHAPSGMRPPPSGAWRRPIHHGPRDLRDRNERSDRGNWGPRRDAGGDRGDRDQPREDRVDRGHDGRGDRREGQSQDSFRQERLDRGNDRRGERDGDRGRDSFRGERGDRGQARGADSDNTPRGDVAGRGHENGDRADNAREVRGDRGGERRGKEGDEAGRGEGPR